MDFQIFLENPLIRAALEVALILLATIVLYKFVRWFVERYARQLAALTKSRLDDLLINFIDKFLFRLFLIAALYLIGERLSPFSGETAFLYFQKLLYVVVVFVITTLTIRVINVVISFYLEKESARTGSELQKDFELLLHRVVQIVLFLTALIAVLTYFHIDVKGLIATLGVGSLAIALAAQDTLSNMIAGFVIMVDRPFRKGDRIKTPANVIGEVTEIGLRSMKLLDFEKNLHVIPNSEIVKAEIINYSYPDPLVRMRIDVGVAYGSDLRKVKEIILQVFGNHELVLGDPAPQVFFTNFGNSSLDLMCISYIRHYRDAWTTTEELRLQIYEAFNKNGIEIPFPQRVVHLEKES